MWKFIIAAVIAISVWLYLNPSVYTGLLNNAGNQALNQIQQEKTINVYRRADSADSQEQKNVMKTLNTK